MTSYWRSGETIGRYGKLDRVEEEKSAEKECTRREEEERLKIPAPARIQNGYKSKWNDNIEH